MALDEFVQTEFDLVDAYSGIDSVRNILADHMFCVVFQEGNFSGILTSNDFVHTSHKLVIDCLQPKPQIDIDQSIASVIGIMRKYRLIAVPVFKKDHFYGIISIDIIIDYLLEHHFQKSQRAGHNTPVFKEENVSSSSLTNREKQVLKLISEGNNTKQIASILVVSVKTVESHRLNIKKKLEIQSIADLTKYAIKEGLTEL